MQTFYPLRKMFSLVVGLMVLVAVGLFSFYAYLARATVTPTVTSLITQATTVKLSSTPAAAIKVVIAVDAAETLAAITVVATDSASTSFAPATDLAALGTDATSGIAIYNDAGSTAGSFDATDAVVTLSSASAFSSGSTTLTLASPGVAGTYYIVYRTAAAAVNGHSFVLTIPVNGIATSSNSPTITAVTTSPIAVDTAAPTVNTNMTGPANLSTSVPISTFIHMGFNEMLDQSTINPTNVTFTANSVAVPAGIRPFPDGFDIVVSSPPTFATSSRFAKLGSTSTAFYSMMSSNPIMPQPPTGYATPAVGDIVITQRETFPAELGLITDATKTAGTFAINGFTSFGSQQITKVATPVADHTGAVSAAAKNLAVGDIIVANTATFPTSVKYDWHIVTAAVSNAAINGGALRLDSLGTAPTFNTHPGGIASSFAAFAPSATQTDNGITEGQVLAVIQGDLVFIKIGSAYGWHLVTTTGNLSSDATENTAFIDGGVADPAIVANSQMSKLTPGAQDAVTASTNLSTGDIVMAHTTANASNGGAYAFHMVSGGAAVNNTALRFDNFPGSLTPSTAYVVTATTGVKDFAGNPLAANNTLTFTTGSTGGTNTTPPAVVSSQPQSGGQTHPIGAPIKLTFSVDMASSEGGSITADANIALTTAVNGQPGVAVTTTKQYDSPSKTVTLTPSAPLTASTDYVVKINTTATSATGSASTAPYFLFFRTPSGAADTAAPTVQGVSPANAATGAALGTVVTAGFSEDINSATLTTSTVTLSGGITGTVTYNPQSRSVSFAPSTALVADTVYTFTIVGGGSDPRVKDLSGNALSANYTSTFRTTATADTTKPILSSANADNFSVVVNFSEQVKSGGGPNAADNIANFTLESPTGSTISLGGKTVTYEAGTKTARITGLSLQNGNTFKVTVQPVVQDLAGNVMETTGTPASNLQFGTVANSTTTGGQIGPGGGTINFSTQGMNPTRVTPMTRSAGGTSTYHIEFLGATSIPSTGQIVLTFPSGFTLTGAAAVSTTNSFCNADLNSLAGNVPTIGSVSANNDAGTITITTAGADTGTNSFLCMDISGIVNSTVPTTAGYTVTIQTKDIAAAPNNRATLQTLTASPFFLGQAGSRTLTVNVFKDSTSTGTLGTKDSGEGIPSATVYLFSPASGGQEATTTTGASGGVATFTSLADGDYMVGIKPTAAINVAFNSMPQPHTISSNAATQTKNFALSGAAAITISGTIAGPNGTSVDVFASSPNGFAKTTIALLGAGTPVAYSMPVSPNTTYNIGVGPAMPETSFSPGAPPPPPPVFTFMPPAPLSVTVVAVSVTGQNFVLTATNKTITGTVVDSSGGGIANAGVFCRPSESSTGTSGGFGTGGQTNNSGAFTLNVSTGVYLCGVFKPGMPPAPDKQITVGASANTPTSLAFIIDVATTLTISGTLKDDSGNAIPYGGVGGRKVVSTSNTAAVGGDSGNFAGGPTDANGAYTLYVTAGTWVVEAYAPGFGKLGTKTITVTTSSLSGQDFSAETLSVGTITGTATRAAVATQGVMVRADGSSGGNMAVTASDGTYSLKVPAGTYTVTCFFPGVGESTPLTSVAVTASTTTSGQNCTLAAPITITVNLTDGTNPITNAGVEVRDSNGRGNFTSTSTTSSENAVYVVTVPPGTYTVRAGHPAYGSLGTTAAVSTTQAITYNVGNTKQLYAVTGTVTGTTAGVTTALSGAWVSLNGTPTGATNTVFLGAQTASDGTFTINVPPGAYRLRADKPGYKSPAETAVTVTTAAVSAGTIALVATTQTITGTVTLDGSGISNAFVDATDGAGGYAVAQTNASGAYSLGVANGTWTIRAHSSGYEGGPLPVTVNSNNPSGQTITLTAISGFTVTAERPETVTPTSGGFIGNTDIGTHFQLEIPANALGTGSNAATVTTKINTAMPNPPSGAILSKNAVSIDAVDSAGSPISSLNDEITITIPYTEADLPSGTTEASLVIGVWNDATATYDTLSTTVDTTLNTLTATVSHLSDFAPLIASGGSNTDTPAGLTLANQGNGSTINLTWIVVSGASTYNVYRSVDGGSTFPLLASASTNAYSATSLTAGTTYYFKVSSVNSTGDESAASSAMSMAPSLSAVRSGGGGGAIAYATSAILSTIPAATVPTAISGCGNRNTGFSTSTGQSCVGNTSTTPATLATPSTSALANASPNARFNLGTVTLKNGSKGEPVKELQRVLNKILKMNLAVDGKLGPKTIATIKTWQKAHGLKADGLVGPKTKAAMVAEANK